MKLFGELRDLAQKQTEEGELPVWLLEDILAIADSPEIYSDKVHLVEQLIDQINNFDAYAGTGCFDSSVSSDTIAATIRRIKM